MIPLGGLYFIISRSIGPGFGASIGILLALANTISAAMNTLGFCLSLRSLLQQYGITFMDSNIHLRGVGVVSIIIMSILCCIGMDREAEVCESLHSFIIFLNESHVPGTKHTVGSDNYWNI